MQQLKKKIMIMLCIIYLILLSSVVYAQEHTYKIGKGDVLEIAFWQDHTLDVNT